MNCFIDYICNNKQCTIMEATKVNIQDIARYTILRLIQNGDTICPLKLQKVLYYMQAWHMVYFDRENTLFDDVPEAWVNGPVYRSVYETYKAIPMYEQIQPKSFGFNSPKELRDEAERIYKLLSLTKDQNDFIESIYRHYGTMSHDRLVYLTHSQAPWNNARKGLDAFEYSNQLIKLEDMFQYYSEMQKK